MTNIIDRKKALAEAIKSGATVRITDAYGTQHVGVVVGGNARAILINLGGDIGRQSLVEKDGIANVELA